MDAQSQAYLSELLSDCVRFERLGNDYSGAFQSFRA